MVPIIRMMMPTSQYALKSPKVTPKKYIVIHNTANKASAKAEVSYMIGNTSSTSFHAAVDENEIVEGIPYERNAWHCGDGSDGIGNLYGYAIEICRSLSDIDTFKKAEQNAAEYAAYLLKKTGLPITAVRKHQDFNGKVCPHKTLELGWKRFIDMVQSELDKLTPVVVEPPKPSGVTMAPAGKLYRVGLGSFAVRENALKLRDEAIAKGFEAYLTLIDDPRRK